MPVAWLGSRNSILNFVPSLTSVATSFQVLVTSAVHGSAQLSPPATVQRTQAPRKLDVPLTILTLMSAHRLLVVNSGTVSSHRLRGYVRPSYNLLEVTQDRIVVTLRYPGTGERHAAELDRRQMRLHANPDLAGMFAKSAWHA